MQQIYAEPLKLPIPDGSDERRRDIAGLIGRADSQAWPDWNPALADKMRNFEIEFSIYESTGLCP